MTGEPASTTVPDPAAPDCLPAPDRARSAWLANKRQELLAPVGALVELGEVLLKDARDRGQEKFLADLECIHASGKTLILMVGDMLDPVGPAADGDELARRVRHELRTPLTQIIGLCEIWLEDAAEELLEGFTGDLEAVHTLAKKLLARLDELLDFSKVAGDPELDLDDPSGDAIRDIVKDVAAAKGACETGTLQVVDDNEASRDILRRRVTREGHTVALAADGRQALELLQRRSFDLVLLDVIMPQMDGFQVLKRLKADEGLRHLPVVMVSAISEIDTVARCLELGAEDYLPKPINSALLRARINACLEKKRLRDREQTHLASIRREQERADGLLHVILPAAVVRELKETNAVLPRRHENVAVMFGDIVGFTPFCDNNPPEQVVPYLQGLIETWEEIAVRHKVDKIKTIGDAFMAAAGLLQKVDNPVLACVRCGLEMIAACRALPTRWDLRVGVHLGPVVAGVLGRRQYLFDLWGDTVNTAARMESHGVPGQVVLSGPAWRQVAQLCRGQSLGDIPVKGKGPLEVMRFDGFLT